MTPGVLMAALKVSAVEADAAGTRAHFATVLEALPESALEARLALTLLARRMGANIDRLKGWDGGAPTVTRHEAKEAKP